MQLMSEFALLQKPAYQQTHILRVLYVLVAALLFALTPLWDQLSNLEHDLLAALTAPPWPTESKIQVIGLDDPSLAQLDLPLPLPRRLHAELIGELERTGVKALAFDLLFDRPAADPADDAALQQALNGQLKIVLAEGEIQVNSSQVAHYRQRLLPIFQGVARGRATLQVDADGVVRRMPTATESKQSEQVASAEISSLYSGLLNDLSYELPEDMSGSPPLWWQLAKQADHAVPMPPTGALLRPYAPETPLPYLHYTQALRASQQLAPDSLKNTILLLGQHTPLSREDQFLSPLRLLGQGMQSGVFIHATALANALQHAWVLPLPSWVPWLQGLVLLLLISVLSRQWQGKKVLLWTVLLALFAIAISSGSYIVGRWQPALASLLLLAIHLNMGAAGSYWRERQRKEAIRQDFARYVPPAVVDHLLDSREHARGHAERRELSLLFSDLAGFTSVSEQLAPEELAQALNCYFSVMTRIVHENGGTLDKFIGDAVMAFWNAPLDQQDHAERALRCAQQMQAAMQELREQWQGNAFAHIHMRIGLHTGEAAVGHLGSLERFTYTAVGDAVNTAARLEGANKAFGTGILLSAQLQQKTTSSDLFWLDQVILAGRSHGIDVYTVCQHNGHAKHAEIIRLSHALQQSIVQADWPAALAYCWQLPMTYPGLPEQWAQHRRQLGERLKYLHENQSRAEDFARALDK